MTDEAVIQGNLVDVRNVGSHKSVRLYIDVPQEYGGRVVEAFGWPTQTDPVPVAVARMMTEGELHKGLDEIAAPKPKSYAQRAGILSNDPAFWRFLDDRGYPGVSAYAAPEQKPEIAAMHIREWCGVKSRRDIIEGTPAGNAFRDIEAEFAGWRRL